MSEKGFDTWLIEKKNLEKRSASDVSSRWRRANRILSSDGLDYVHYIFELEQIDSFCSLSISVKSQIKRAIKFMYEYLEEVDKQI